MSATPLSGVVLHRAVYMGPVEPLQLPPALVTAARSNDASPVSHADGTELKERATTNVPSVLVVGAGASGLQCAAALVESGADVRVFEGRSRTGGRIHTRAIQDGICAELGANFIQGVAGDSLLMKHVLRLKMNASVQEGGYRNAWLVCPVYTGDKPGHKVPDSRISTLYQLSMTIRNAILSINAELSKERDLATLVRDQTAREVRRLKLDLSDHDKNVLHHYDVCSYFYGGPPGEVGVALHRDCDDPLWDEERFPPSLTEQVLDSEWRYTEKGAGEAMPPHEVDGLVLSGLNTVTNDLAAVVETRHPIMLGWRCTHISHDDIGAEATFANDAGETRTERADYLVCTVPLGVLKAPIGHRSHIQFSPPLSTRKQDAISRMALAHENKVHAQYTEAKWATRLPFYFNICSSKVVLAGLPLGPNTRWINHHRFSHGKSRCFIGIASPELIRALGKAGIPEDSPEVQDAFSALLASAFGPDAGVFSYFKLTRWDLDPFSLGSFSSLPPNTSSAEIDAFFAPEGAGRLRFAGEHTVQDGNQCVHGALRSGLLAARRIAVENGLRWYGLPEDQLSQHAREWVWIDTNSDAGDGATAEAEPEVAAAEPLAAEAKRKKKPAKRGKRAASEESYAETKPATKGGRKRKRQDDDEAGGDSGDLKTKRKKIDRAPKTAKRKR